MAGVGNWNTAQFWEYNTRTCLRINKDPIVNPRLSPYSSFNLNPICYADRLGNVGEPVVRNGQLFVYSDFLFYGGAATAELGSQAAYNIQTQWNDAHGKMTYLGVEYQNVRFVVTSKIVSETDAKNAAIANTGEWYNPRLNFGRIEWRSDVEKATGDKEDYSRENQASLLGNYIAGDNSFFFLADDICPGNTSQAHEYGHGLGNSHSSDGKHVSGQPDIMSTLRSLVEGNYTVNHLPSIDQGQLSLPLNPLNPYLRKVLPINFLNIKINIYDKGLYPKHRFGSSSNGIFTNQGDTELFDNQGRLIGGTLLEKQKK